MRRRLHRWLLVFALAGAGAGCGSLLGGTDLPDLEDAGEDGSPEGGGKADHSVPVEGGDAGTADAGQAEASSPDGTTTADAAADADATTPAEASGDGEAPETATSDAEDASDAPDGGSGPDVSDAAPVDVAVEAAPDAGPDAAADVGPEAAPDAPPDAPPEAAPEASADAAPEAETDGPALDAPAEAEAGPTCGTCGTHQHCGDAGACVCDTGYSDCSGACVNEQLDPANCGACGHDCLGGGCFQAACQPYTVTSANAIRIASDGAHVFWTDATSNAAMQIPAAGGTAITLQAGGSSSTLDGIAVAAGQVGFTGYGASSHGVQVWQDAVGHAGATELWPNLDTGSILQPGFALSSGAEWFCVIDSSAARCCPFATGQTCVPLSGSTYNAQYIAVNSTSFYWTDYTHVYAVPWTPTSIGSVGTLIPVPNGQVNYVAADDAYVYWLQWVSSSEINLQRVSTAGTGFTTLHDFAVGGWQSLASDGTNLYAAQQVSSGSVYVMAANGSGNPATLWSQSGANPQSLVYAGGALFWIDAAAHQIWGLRYP